MVSETKILVVEDEGIVALDIQMRLEGLGYTICGVVATGEDAINKAESAHPNLILMDINLKGQMTGIEAAEQIRSQHNIPVVYLTANTDDKTLNQAKLTAPYGYIMKPFEERALYATIESALHRYMDEQSALSQSKAQYQDTVQTYEEQFHWLSKLDVEIADSLNIDHVLSKVLETAMRLSGASAGYTGVIEDGKWHQLKTDNYPVNKVTQALKVSSHVMRVIQKQQAVFIPDVTHDSEYGDNVPDTKSKIIIPFIARDNLFGILNLEANQVDVFTRQIFEIMKVLVTRTAIAIDNARLFRLSQNQVNELQELHQELLDYSYRDTLTELPNRRKFEDYVDTLIASNNPQDAKFAILCLDLDGFKIIIDNYGHPVGDAVLQQVANRLKNVLGADNLLARMGGDEFVVVQPLSGYHLTVKQLAEIMIATIAKPMIIGDYRVQIGTSIGICLAPHDGINRVDLLRQADRALYHAKENGKNRFSFYDTEFNNDFSDISISQQLQGVLERDELQLYYQPLVDSKTREIVGAEALLRWHHPQWGMVMPDQFIPVALKNEMIIPMTEWLLVTACKQRQAWEKAGYELFVSINVTALQFESNEFVRAVSHALLANSMEAKWLKIEITEDTALSPTKSGKYLRELSDIGVEIAIDDFGKGYSSLDYLQHKYINLIKIDKLLTQGIGSTTDIHERSKSIIKAINELAHNLGIKVVVEGVETETQYEFLKEIGCDVIQGYLIGKPMPSSNLLEMLANRGE